jgi:hypothetical protein
MWKVTSIAIAQFYITYVYNKEDLMMGTWFPETCQNKRYKKLCLNELHKTVLINSCSLM